MLAPKAGTTIAQVGDQVWATTFGDTVPVMPCTSKLKPGGNAVRLVRFEA